MLPEINKENKYHLSQLFMLNDMAAIQLANVTKYRE